VKSRGALGGAGKTAPRPVSVGDEMQELYIWWNVFRLAPRLEHVVCQMELIIFPAVVLAQEHLNGTPRAFNGVCVRPSTRIDELDAVVDGVMRVTLSAEIAVRSPGIADDRSTGFDPVTYNGHQCVGGSVRYRNKECFAGFSFHTTEHPLPLYGVSPMVFAPTEHALINFDGLVRTTNFNGAAL